MICSHTFKPFLIAIIGLSYRFRLECIFHTGTQFKVLFGIIKIKILPVPQLFLAEVDGGGSHRGSLKFDVWLTWSLSVCLLRIRGDKREGQTGFVAKTAKVMVRLAPSRRGAPGKGTRHCARSILCAVFRPSPHSLPTCKGDFFSTALIFSSVNLHCPNITEQCYVSLLQS